ncbi:hypothetical protein SLA2020_066900 [Shorea laevis]
MTDLTTPLLQRNEEEDPEKPGLEEQHSSSSHEVIELKRPKFGWILFLQVILLSIARIFEGQQTFISVYTDAEPTWHCTDESACDSISDICQLPLSVWTWDEPSYTTIVSDWEIQCSSSFLAGLPATSFFIGNLFGRILLASLADSLVGRKNLLLMSCVSMSVASVLTIFSPNIWVYSVLRFICGFGRASIGTCTIVLSTEMVQDCLRGQVGVIIPIFFSIGYLSLPAIAYMNGASSWRTLYLWTSIPAILYCPILHFFVPESPRWLSIREAPQKGTSPAAEMYSSVKILFQRNWIIKRLILVMLLGFGVGITYYGVQMGVSNLGFNTNLTITFNAISEIISFITLASFIGKLKRRTLVLSFSVVGGICCISCALVKWNWVQLGLEMLSLFCGCMAFGSVVVYTVELFPTCVRNLTTSMMRQAAILAAVSCPVLVSAGRKEKLLSYGVFGSVMLCCGLFVCCLPETKNSSLCDTVDEQEQRENSIK